MHILSILAIMHLRLRDWILKSVFALDRIGNYFFGTTCGYSELLITSDTGLRNTVHKRNIHIDKQVLEVGVQNIACVNYFNTINVPRPDCILAM